MTHYPALPRPIDEFATPPLHDMRTNPSRFEKMSAALMGHEPGVRSSRLYSVNGAPQFGIDVLGEIVGGAVVASCKCYEKISATKLREWSDNFLAHLDGHWKDRGVAQFILITAAANSTTLDVNKGIAAERKRFAAKGLRYDLWGPEDLVHRLKSQREITYRFLDPYWTDRLCGGRPPPLSGGLSAFQLAEFDALRSGLAELVQRHVDAAVDAIRREDRPAAQKIVDDLDRNAAGQSAVVAQVLRLRANLAIWDADLDEAERLLDEADKLASGEPRLRALIASERSGPEEGLTALGEPSTLRGHQLRIGFLINLQRYEEAAEELAPFLAGPDDPVTLRLSALAMLALGQRDEALAAIMKAEIIAPEWVEVIHAAAVIRYAMALSPSVGTDWIFYPNAVDDGMVRRDDASRAHLHDALKGFEKLSQRLASRREETVWRLACLCNLEDRELEAQTEVQALLAVDRCDLDAIAWGLSRGLEFDRAASLDAMQQVVAAGSPTPSQIRVYCWLLATLQPYGLQTALSVSTSLEGAAQEELNLWRDAADGSALTVIDVTAPSAPLAILRRAQDLRSRGNWSSLENELAQHLLQTPIPPTALKLAEVLLEGKRASFLMSHVDRLLEFNTAEAVRICAFIVQGAGSNDDLLAFLERHRGAFTGGELPEDLRRIEVQAQALRGRLDQAMQGVSLLAQQTGKASDRLAQAHINLMRGDGASARPILTEIIAQDALDPDAAIQFSAAYTRSDPRLAKRLVRHAISKGVSDAHVGNLLAQAYRLGLDTELDAVRARLPELASQPQGPIRIANLEELGAYLERSRAAQRKILEPFEAGAAPVHLLPERLGTKLANVYRLDRPHHDRSGLSAIYVRHGGRPLHIPVAGDWRTFAFHLDITALLIADQLDILRHIEGLAHPIRISPSVPDALVQLENEALHHQRTQVESAAQILAARADGSLAMTELGPVRSRLHDEERDTREGANLKAIVEGLLLSGRLEDPAAAQALIADSDDDAEVEAGAPPEEGAPLTFSGPALQRLTVAGLLPAVLQHYRCRIDVPALQRLIEVEKSGAEGDALADRVVALRERIAEGLGRTYVFVDSAQLPEKVDASTAIENTLLDLIAAPPVQNGVVWVEDRYVSGFTSSGPHLVLGVVEMLGAMVASATISAEDRRQKLLKLRAGGALFIPLGVDEILAALDGASVVDGKVVETQALSVLRRYVGLALKHDAKLRMDPNAFESTKGQPQEIDFIPTLRTLLDDALQAIWNDPKRSLSDCQAYSNWLWGGVGAERLVRPFPDGHPEDVETLYAATLAAGLLIGGQSVAVVDWPETKRRRRAYFAWIDQTILLPRSGLGHEAYLAAVVQQTSGIIIGTLNHTRSDGSDAEASSKRIMRALIAQMPTAVTERLFQDTRFTWRLGIPTARFVNAGKHTFEFEHFWTRIQRALRYGEAKLRDRDGKRVWLRRYERGLRMSGQRTGLYSPQFALAAADHASVAPLVRASLNELDLAAADIERHLDAILSAGTVGGRIAALSKADEQSVISNYQEIADTIRDHRPARSNLFRPPPVASLLHHIRQPEAGSFGAEAWRVLRQKIGPTFAFRRRQGLPVLLADTLTADLKSLGTEGAFNSIVSAARTPMALLQAAKLAENLGRVEDHEALTARFVSETIQHGDLFTALLSWTERAYQCDPMWAATPPADRLAGIWSHSDLVLDVLLGHGTSGPTIKDFFDANPLIGPLSEALSRHADFVTDCAHPELMSAEALLYHGLGALISTPERLAKIAPDHMAALSARLTTETAGVTLSSNPLLIRVADGPDHLGSFLKSDAHHLFGLPETPNERRERELAEALDRLEANSDDADAWIRIAAVGRPFLNPSQAARMTAVFSNVDLWRINQSPHPDRLARVVVETQCRLAPRVDEAILQAHVRHLAERAKAEHRGRIRTRSPAKAAFDDILEIAAAMSRSETGEQAIERFSSFSFQIVMVWSDAAEPMRELFNTLTCRADPQYAGLWRAYVELRTCP